MKSRLLLAAVALFLAVASRGVVAQTFNSTTVEERNISYYGGPVISGAVSGRFDSPSIYFVFHKIGRGGV